ncbi:MAG: hypothetical protein V3S41_10260, partial [Spirochaetia bacterium]
GIELERRIRSCCTGSKAGDQIAVDYIADRSGLHYFFIESISGVGFVVPEYTPVGTFYTISDGRPARPFVIAIALLSFIAVLLLTHIIIRRRARANGDSGSATD